MLIPKCCKGCSRRKNGVCNCTLPIFCNEWVEDDETYPTNVGGVINTPNTAPSDIKIGDPYPCGSDGTNTELQKNWWNGTWRNYEQGIGNWVQCPDCEDFKKQLAEKDKEIAELREKSEELWQIYSHLGVEAFGEDIHEQALKEIEQKDHRIAVLERALKLVVNVLQREIDGDYIKATEVQAIYEIGKDYFIDQAEKELEGE